MGFGIPRSDSEAKILVNRAQGVPKNSLSVYLVLVPILARITYPHWYLLVAADPTPARLRFSCRHVRGVASVVIITLKIIEKYYASRLKSMTHAWTTFCVTTIIHGFQFSNLHKYDLSCTCFSFQASDTQLIFLQLELWSGAEIRGVGAIANMARTHGGNIFHWCRAQIGWSDLKLNVSETSW